MRVVSLLPSATEMLCLIGAERYLVGRSHECDFPASIADRPVLTTSAFPLTTAADVDRTVSSAISRGESLYRLDSDRLQELRPDLIITQDLCSVCSIDLQSVRRATEQIDPQPSILSLNPSGFEDVLDDILRVGEAVGFQQEAVEALAALRERFFRASDFVNPFANSKRVACLEWTDPLFIAGHWTPQLIERAGGEHRLNPTIPFEGAGAGTGCQGAFRSAGPSRRISDEDLVAARPEALIVSPCGMSLQQASEECARLARNDWWCALPAVRQNAVFIVDGNQMFSRPGPRLVDAYEWLVGVLNDRAELIPQNFPWTLFQAAESSR